MALDAQEANTESSKKFWKRGEAAAVYDLQFQNKIGRYIDCSETFPLLELVRNLRGAKVLDVGCGTGRFLARFPDGNTLFGMDLSENMLQAAQKKIHRAHLTVASATAIPFPDNSFDLVYSVRVIQHIRDQQRMIAELSRVCKPGGHVILITYNTWSLLNIYKHIRMSWLGRILNIPFGFILKERSFFGPWGFEYDNYCSIPEVRRMYGVAGLKSGYLCGLSSGMPWFLQSFFIGKILQMIAPWLLSGILDVALWADRTIARLSPFKYFMDLVMVVGEKRK
ncbi:MAG TPA: class I SAM-dependent methyltransferase [Candidatus Omnitrophota bacterium]|nr:class I SAM-dependent methyltransferase [Candidatus Omnitrophota bacterium]